MCAGDQKASRDSATESFFLNGITGLMYTDIKLLNRSVKNVFCSLYITLKEADYYGRMVKAAQDPNQADFIGFKTFHEEVQFLFSTSQLDICLMTTFNALKEIHPELTHLCKTYMHYRDSAANYGDERKKSFDTLERMYYLIIGIQNLCEYGSYYVPIAKYLAEANVDGAHKFLKLFENRNLYELASVMEQELKEFGANVGFNTSKKFVLKHLISNVDDGERDERMGNRRSKNFLPKQDIVDIIEYAQELDICTS